METGMGGTVSSGATTLGMDDGEYSRGCAASPNRLMWLTIPVVEATNSLKEAQQQDYLHGSPSHVRCREDHRRVYATLRYLLE